MRSGYQQPFSHSKLWFMLAVGLVVIYVVAAGARAQPESGATSQTAEVRSITLMSTIHDGGVVGYIIILMSLVSVALIVEHFISIRREELLPTELIQRLEEHLHKKDYSQAQQDCAEDGSFLALVVGAGLNQIGSMFGFFDMQNSMQEVSERQLSKLYRKLDYLSFIAATAPMLGLLGTVTGMIRSFNKISMTEGMARPSDLAQGISEALVTTCMGLVVAIPTMFFVSFFRNRIDGYVAEAEVVVEKLTGRFRKGTA